MPQDDQQQQTQADPAAQEQAAPPLAPGGKPAPPAGLAFDQQNANRGTRRGRELLEHSLQEYGAGRSVLADKNGALIAGNKTLEKWNEQGRPVRIIQPTGDELVVVQRTDLDLYDPNDRRGRELAYADNRVGELDLAWDADQLIEDRESGVDLSRFWTDPEYDLLLDPTPPGDSGPASKINHAEHWEGMPGYEQENAGPIAKIIVSFMTEDAIADFAQRIGQNVTSKTQGITHPRNWADFHTEAYQPIAQPAQAAAPPPLDPGLLPDEEEVTDDDEPVHEADVLEGQGQGQQEGEEDAAH